MSATVPRTLSTEVLFIMFFKKLSTPLQLVIRPHMSWFRSEALKKTHRALNTMQWAGVAGNAVGGSLQHTV